MDWHIRFAAEGIGGSLGMKFHARRIPGRRRRKGMEENSLHSGPFPALGKNSKGRANPNGGKKKEGGGVTSARFV